MPGFPSGDFCKYVVGGAVASDDWSVGVWVNVSGLTALPSVAQMNGNASALLTAFNNDIWSAATAGQKTVNASGCSLSTIKTYLYRDGVLVRQGTASITAVAGTSATVLPFFTAMCCSLLTETAGRSGRGRIYLPMTAGALLATTGQMNVGSLSSYAGNVATWLSALSTDEGTWPGDPAMRVCVLFKTHSDFHFVTSTRIDSLVDTQHGRTRKDLATSVGTGTVTHTP